MQAIPWSSQSPFPVLATLQLLPLIAVIAAGLFRGRRTLLFTALAVATAELLLAVWLLEPFDRATSAFQFSESLTLLGPLRYHAALDGIGMLFVLLTALLSLLLLLYGTIRPFEPQRRFIAVLFLVEAILISSVVTVDLLWFVAMSFIQLLPVGYLLIRWSTSPDKEKALFRFLQFMGSALLLLVIGTLMLGWQFAETHSGRWSFDLFALASTTVAPELQTAIFFLLFYGMAIRIPIFPLHGWLPTISEHGTVAVAPLFLLGIKTGVYGLLRFVLPLLPEAVMQWHQYVVIFAATGVFYAALLALTQSNLRRLLAFAVISHSGILVIGLFSLSHTAFQGSILLAINFGLAVAGLLFMTGMIFQRTRTTLLPQLGGLFDRLPVVGVAFFIAGLSIVGMPGTPGFDAVHLVLEAAMHRYGALLTIAAALGNVVAAGFLLWAFQRAFLGERPEGMREVARASRIENLLAITVVMVLLGVGFYSEPWVELIEVSLVPLGELYAMHTPPAGH